MGQSSVNEVFFSDILFHKISPTPPPSSLSFSLGILDLLEVCTFINFLKYADFTECLYWGTYR